MSYPKVICAFPCTGKSHFVAAHKDGPVEYHDSDSSSFSWLPGTERKRDPAFPGNYIEHIKGLKGVVLASSHIAVRDALAEAGIPYDIVTPSIDCKAEYLERARERGSAPELIYAMDQHWDAWVRGMMDDRKAARRYVIGKGNYLSDVLT